MSLATQLSRLILELSGVAHRILLWLVSAKSLETAGEYRTVFDSKGPLCGARRTAQPLSSCLPGVDMTFSEPIWVLCSVLCVLVGVLDETLA